MLDRVAVRQSVRMGAGTPGGKVLVVEGRKDGIAG